MILTKQIKYDVVKAAIDDTVTPRRKLLISEMQKVARKVVVEAVPKEVREWLDAAPKGVSTDVCSMAYLKSPEWFDTILADELGTRRYSGQVTALSFQPVKIPPEWSHRGTYEPTGQQLVEWKYLVSEYNKLEKECTALKAAVKAALEACRTSKQLLERYPILDKYLPKEVATKALAITEERVQKALACAKTGEKKDCK